MSTPAQGRSVTVTSLSGRVQALKFMQRGGANKESTNAEPSTPTQTAAKAQSTPTSEYNSPTASPKVSSASYGQEEEQWSLSPSAISKLTANARTKASHSSLSTVEHDAGFDSWLLSRDSRSTSSSTNTRQTFGTFKTSAPEAGTSTESKKRSRDSTDDTHAEPDFDEEDDQEDLIVEDNSQHRGSGVKQEKRNGFIKPGTLQGSGKSKSSPSPSSKKTIPNKQKDQDKVIYARKRGGKQGISGGRS